MQHRPVVIALAVTTLALAGCATVPTGTADVDPRAGVPPRAAVWVANEGSGSLTVLDASTGETITTIDGLAAPHNVQASQAQAVVWVTSGAGVVAISAHELYATRVAETGPHPAHVVESATGGVYATSTGTGTVHAWDAELDNPDTIRIGGGPHGMRIDADGETGVVANTAKGTLDVLDLTAGVKTASIIVGPAPVQVAIDARGTFAFVSVSGVNKIMKVDLTTEQTTSSVDVPSAPAQIWLTTSGLLLSADQGTRSDPGSTLTVIDAETMTVVDSIVTGSGPHGITVSSDEKTAWVTNTYDDSVSVIDLGTSTVTATLAVGDAPNGITFAANAPHGNVEDVVTLSVPPAYAGTGHSTKGHDEGAGHGSATTPTEDPHAHH